MELRLVWQRPTTLPSRVLYSLHWYWLAIFSMNLFAPLVMSSVVATMVSRFWFGIDPWYVLPKNLPETVSFSQAASFSQIGWFILLGIFSGLCGAFFLKSIQKAEVMSAKRAWPCWVKLGLAGLVVGLVALVFPGVWGNGYDISNKILQEDALQKGYSDLVNGSVLADLAAWQIPIVILGGLVLAKFLTTVVAVGSGTIGGVFTPTLFLGAGLGAAFSQALGFFEFAGELPGGFALVRDGKCSGGNDCSPLFAMILILKFR